MVYRLHSSLKKKHQKITWKYIASSLKHGKFTVWYYIEMVKYVSYCTCIHSIPFKRVWHSFEKVAFKTHSSPCERVLHGLGSCNMYVAIPLKEGDVSVRTCSMTPWNRPLNKHNIPCRKWSVILKGYSSISSYTLRDHGISWGQCGMPLCKFPWKTCNIIFIPLNRGWHSLLRKNIPKLQKTKNNASSL